MLNIDAKPRSSRKLENRRGLVSEPWCLGTMGGFLCTSWNTQREMSTISREEQLRGSARRLIQKTDVATQKTKRVTQKCEHGTAVDVTPRANLAGGGIPHPHVVEGAKTEGGNAERAHERLFWGVPTIQIKPRQSAVGLCRVFAFCIEVTQFVCQCRAEADRVDKNVDGREKTMATKMAYLVDNALVWVAVG